MAVQESCRGQSMNDSLYRERRQEGWSTESGSSTDEDATLTAPLVTDLDYLDYAMDLIRKNIENLSMNDSLYREKRQEGWSTESGSSTDEDATLTAPLVKES